MKLFNPTPESIRPKFNGVEYIVNAGHFIDFVQETGEWALQRWAMYGLVDITEVAKSGNMQEFIVRKTLEGLDNYIIYLQSLLDQYIVRDTEEKSVNLYGTVLKHKNVKRIGELLEIATRMVKDIEMKYNIIVKKAEADQRTSTLMASIESIVNQFDNDETAKENERKQELEAERRLREIIPQVVLERSREAHI